MTDTSKSGLFAGRYNLRKQLGQGAFGSVYLAEQEAYGLPFRSVALKMFETPIESGMHAREIFNDAVVLARLLEECDDLQVKSRFIQIYDIGSTVIEEKGKGLVDKGYITMELMDRDLRKVIGETGSDNFRKTTVKEALSYMTPVVEALAYMHSQKSPVLHRDLKPENVLIRKGKEKIKIQVADFGLAVQKFNLLEMPQAAGTIPYQDLESFALRTATTESDVYAIGIMFYELLTGRYPYNIDFSNLEPSDPLSNQIFSSRMRLAMSNPLKPPSAFNLELKKDAWLENIILKCLTPYRVDRIKDAVELKRLLEKGGSEEPIVRTPQEKYKAHLENGKNAMTKGRAHWHYAECDFQEAVKLLRQHCDAIVELAHLLVEIGKLDDAERLLNERNQQNRECPHVYNELSYLYGKRGNQGMKDFYLEKAEKISECKYSIYKSFK